MIKYLENFSKKSFNNFSNYNDLNFGKLNIIFGQNGQGKSALAEGIYEKSPIDVKEDVPDEPKQTVLFNHDYLEKSMLLKDESGEYQKNKFYGVKTIFGSENVIIEQQIESKADELLKLEKESDKSKGEQGDCFGKFKNQVDKIRKKTSGIKRVNNKTGNDPKVILSQYKVDFSNIKKLFPDENYDDIIGDNRYEKRILDLEKIQEKISFTHKEIDFNEIENIKIKTYNNEEIPTINIVEWVKKGLSFHNEKDTCKFCGSKEIILHEISDKIDTWNKNEKQTDSIIIRNFISSLKETLVKYKELTNIDVEQFLKDEIPEYDENKRNLFENSLQNLEKVIETLDSESISVDFFQNQNLDLESLEENYNKLREIYDFILRKIDDEMGHSRKKEKKLQEIVKCAIAKKVIGDKEINDLAKTYEVLDEKIKDLQLRIDKLREEIREIEQEKSDFGKFSDYLNDQLKKRELEFCLELQGENYFLKHKNPDVKINVNNISEGEKNLLAFIYFYFSLFKDIEKKQMKDELKTIIIDDAITSLDNENRIYLLNKINSIVNIAKQSDDCQLFIFTHIWEDYCDITFDDSEIKQFEVYKKNENGSNIRLLRKTDIPYKKFFKEVYEYSKTEIQQVISNNSYHIQNSIRRILEEYIFYIENSTKVDDKMTVSKALFFKEIAEDDEMMGDVLTLLKVSNIYNSGIEKFQNPKTIQQSAKFLMDRIKDLNPVHFEAMIGEKIND